MPSEFEQKIFKLLFPYASKEIDTIENSGAKFAHYTSAEAAVSIIRNHTVWMRSAATMNDFSEMRYGQNLIDYAYRRTSNGQRLKAFLDLCHQGLADEFEDVFEKHKDNRLTQSYLISVSRHGDENGAEDQFGRLSMWRAYGGDTNVAFVFNNEPFFSPSNAVNAFTSPVFYCTEAEFFDEFQSVVQNLEDNFSLFSQLSRQELRERLFNAFHFAVLSTKHPGFAEEKEWRVIHSPKVHPSKHIQPSVRCVSGVPQKVYDLKIRNYPDEDIKGATLPEFLHKIIIGPTQYPYPIYDALVSELEAAGVAAPESKVVVSDIPLRR
ncbi:DUF2971 domain-containing protein [Phaeobacter inhibens]|uniref:DUF2971 domain-containing protein n=1 Tax=Phaeobacter inhibens TaxID=221822 RepID=UPI0021A835AD|nr:DUF2971 domain-containing protein [Phaeobacter inhibens]UWR50171.1 DUF2971 domain-containing protein [Phaeobacter inhibens]UWS09096.1 DUF2971 domain-containing protein [Phaeobacter inhibens]